MDKAHPFHWSHVQLNLPGSLDYDPSLPWVAKRREDGSLASEFYIYVDDVRITASSEEVLQVSYLTVVFRMQPANGDLPLPDQVLRQDPWYTSTINMLVFTSIKISGKKPRDT